MIQGLWHRGIKIMENQMRKIMKAGLIWGGCLESFRAAGHGSGFTGSLGGVVVGTEQELLYLQGLRTQDLGSGA